MFPFDSYDCYIIFNKKEQRKYVHLVPKLHIQGLKRRTITLAKWLLSIKYKRILKPEEQTHHKNDNKQDNRIFNLEILPEIDHHKKHATGQMYLELVCPQCKNKFTVLRRNTHFVTKTRPVTCCSYLCSSKLMKVTTKDQRLLLQKDQHIIRQFLAPVAQSVRASSL